MKDQENIKIFFKYNKSKSSIPDIKNKVIEFVKSKSLTHYFKNEVDEDLQTEVIYKTALALIDNMFGTLHIFALDGFIMPILLYIQYVDDEAKP